MMNIEVHRFGFGTNSCLGRLSAKWQDQTFECFTLEDERRRVKVKGETCIPPGTYEIKLRPEGGMHARYAERFPEIHKGMLWLQNVDNFTFCYLHIGNKESHTAGCLLVGYVPIILPDGEFEIARSKDAYLSLYKMVMAAMDAGDKVAIHITEDERETLAA